MGDASAGRIRALRKSCLAGRCRRVAPPEMVLSAFSLRCLSGGQRERNLEGLAPPAGTGATQDAEGGTIGAGRHEEFPQARGVGH